MLEVVLTSDKPLGAPTILAAVIITFTFLWYWASDERPYAGFPIVGKEKGEWINKKAKERFQMHATQILKQGMSLVCNSCILPFRTEANSTDSIRARFKSSQLMVPPSFFLQA